MSGLTHMMRAQAPWWVAWQRLLMFRDGGRLVPYVDCFGFVRAALLAECGIDLPEWPQLTLDQVTAGNHSLLEPAFTQGFHGLQTGCEQAFDVAVIRRPLPVNNKLVRGWWHVGLVSRSGFIIHMHPAQGMVEEAFRDTALSRASALLKAKDVMLFRHETLATAAGQQRACA